MPKGSIGLGFYDYGGLFLLTHQFKNMDKQNIRNIAADFLDEIRLGVGEILDTRKGGFDFSAYISEWDETHTCGTICCMEGWIPAIRPDITRWCQTTNSATVETINGQVFKPSCVGIPISSSLWRKLTTAGDYFCLRTDSTFEEVAVVWKRISDEIRQSVWDRYLIFDIQ